MTNEELIGLRWAKTCNAEGVGFLGPTVKKRGPIPEYDGLVRSGLLEVKATKLGTEQGYWITEAGLAALRPAARADGAK